MSELGAFGMRVNAITTGLTFPTDSSKFTHRDIREKVVTQTSTGRLTTLEDISGTVNLLASTLSNNLTG
ncbi:SDR family oxidoreductase [Leuconostoc gelidum]